MNAEKAKAIIRKLRQDAMKDLKKDLKSGLSADEHHALEKKVTNLLNPHNVIAQLDTCVLTAFECSFLGVTNRPKRCMTSTSRRSKMHSKARQRRSCPTRQSRRRRSSTAI